MNSFKNIANVWSPISKVMEGNMNAIKNYKGIFGIANFENIKDYDRHRGKLK